MDDSKVIDLNDHRHQKRFAKERGYKLDALKELAVTLLQKEQKPTELRWIDINERVPESSRRWFVVLLEHIGGLKTIESSQFINGEWLQFHKNGFSIITHWAEMPKELP